MASLFEGSEHSGADMRPKTCVFCRSRPANSREHIYRDTYRRYAGTEPYNSLDFETGAITPLKNGESPFTHRVKVVCSDCNNGWMNKLDEDVEDASVAFFEGTPYSCDEEMAANIAYWAAKTTMMRVFKDSDRAIRDDEISYLYDHMEVPPGWLVFLGHTSWAGSLNESRMSWFAPYNNDPDTFTSLPSGILVPAMEPAYFQQHSVVIQQMLLITFAMSGGPEPLPGKVSWSVAVSEGINWLRGQTPAPVVQLWPGPAAFEWPSGLPAHPIENFFPLLSTLPLIAQSVPGRHSTRPRLRSVFKATDRKPPSSGSSGAGSRPGS